MCSSWYYNWVTRGFHLVEGVGWNGGNGKGKNPCPCWGSKSNSSGQGPITISNDMRKESNFQHLNVVWIEVTYVGVQWLGLSDQNSFWTIHSFVVTSRTTGRGLTHCEVATQKIQRNKRKIYNSALNGIQTLYQDNRTLWLTC